MARCRISWLLCLLLVVLISATLHQPAGRCPAADRHNTVPVDELQFTSWKKLIGVLNQPLSSRTPLIIRGVVDRGRLKKLVAGMTSKQTSSRVVVRFVRPGSEDLRQNNLQNVMTENPGLESWTETVDASTFVDGIIKNQTGAGLARTDDWRRNGVSAYWRTEISRQQLDGGRVTPMERKGGTTAHEQMLLEAISNQRSLFAKGVANGTWFRAAVFSRVATTGFRYAPHVDCDPNLLYSLSGHRQVVLVDAKALLNHFPARVSDVLGLKDLQRDAQAQFGCDAPVLVADLHPGDVLLIPVLWLHEVTYVRGGIGVNTFFSSPQLLRKGDPMLCNALKEPKARDQLLTSGQLVDAILHSEAPLSLQ